MITEKLITKIDQLGPILFDQTLDISLDRHRSSSLYKGLNNEKWKLTTSLYRNCREKKNDLETVILRNFAKYASYEDPELKDSVWRQMIIGQHHGLPTRLMDWTRSPLIALHFATTEENFDKMERRDSVVWRIDMRDVNRNLPEKYRRVLEENHSFVFSVDSLMQVADNLETYDADMGAGAIASIEPPSVDQRIINQYSFFSIVPNGMTDIEDFLDKCTTRTVRFVIRKEIRWNVRDLLDQLNINERILYPGLDGLSKTLARHYYVKSEK